MDVFLVKLIIILLRIAFNIMIFAMAMDFCISENTHIFIRKLYLNSKSKGYISCLDMLIILVYIALFGFVGDIIIIISIGIKRLFGEISKIKIFKFKQ